MKTLSVKHCFRLGLALCIAVHFSTSWAAPRRLALLVGVSQYANGGASLEGPAYDVAAMRSVLLRRWNFAEGDIRTLVNQEATRKSILQELRDLQNRSTPDDEVLVYFSGHGYSALSGEGSPPVPHGSGALVPYDYVEGAAEPEAGLIIGRTDLRPLVDGLESGGRRLWVIFDSCFSGQAVRAPLTSGETPLPERLIPAGRRRPHEGLANVTSRSGLPEPYPYRRTGYLAAAAESEIAKDISGRHLAAFPTIDGMPHGAFTDALLRVLEGQWPADYNRDGWLSLNEAHRAVADFMSQRAYGHSPQRLPAVAEDLQALGPRPVLSVRGAVALPQDKQPAPLRVKTVAVPPALQQRLTSVPDVQIVIPGAAFDLSIQADASSIAFVTPAGDAVATLPLSAVTGIVGQLRQRAWAHRLDQLSQRHRRAVLPADISPMSLGGNVAIGTEVTFAVRPDRDATLLLINIDASGQVSVLYPYLNHEKRRLPGHLAHEIQRITVEEPPGMDDQLIWAFDEEPQGLDKLTGVVRVDADDRRLAGLERMLTANAGRFSYVKTELRAYAR